MNTPVCQPTDNESINSRSVILLLLLFLIIVVTVHFFRLVHLNVDLLTVVFLVTRLCTLGVLNQISNLLFILEVSNDLWLFTLKLSTILLHDLLDDVEGLSDFLFTLGTGQSLDLNSVDGTCVHLELQFPCVIVECMSRCE